LSDSVEAMVDSYEKYINKQEELIENYRQLRQNLERIVGNYQRMETARMKYCEDLESKISEFEDIRQIRKKCRFCYKF